MIRSREPFGDLRKLALSEAANEQELRISGLINRPGVGIAICDKHLRFTAINQALATMNGIPPEAHLNKTVHQILGQVASRLEPAMKSVLQTGRPVSNFELIAKLQTRAEVGHWIENYFPIKDDRGKVQKVGVVVVEMAKPGMLSPIHVSDKSTLRSGGRAVSLAGTPSVADSYARFQPGLRSSEELQAASGVRLHDLFFGLDASAIDRILKAARLCTRSSGEVFCRQGQPATKLYLLIAGLVKAGGTTSAGKEVLLDWIQPWESFGLDALLVSPTGNLWTISSVTHSEALEWDAATVCRFADSSPKFYCNALSIALRWACQLQDRVEDLSTQMVEQRLAHMILLLAERFGKKGRSELPISDEELAQMAGTNLYTVNKLLRAWQRLGYVKKGRKRLLVVDSESLLGISRSPR